MYRRRAGGGQALRAIMLALVIQLVGRSQAAEEVHLEVKDLENKGIFLQEANLIIPDAYADVIVDVNLADTEDRIKKNRKIADVLFKDDDVLLKATKARIYTLCDQDLQRWQRTQALAARHQGVAGSRKERFLGLIAAITASAASGIGGYLWGQHEDHVALERLAKEQGKIIRVAQQDQLRIKALTAHSRLQDSILANEVEQSRLREKSFQGVVWLLTAVASQRREVDFLEELVSGVVTQGKATTGLWAPQAFRDLITSLSEEAKKGALRLAVQDEQELLRAPTSYGIFSSQLMRIVLHCPLYRPHSQFRVLRWANLPSKIAGWTQYGRLRTGAASHRLITNGERRSFVARREDMATWWKPRASLYISGHAPIISEGNSHGAAARDCLQELWQSERRELHKRCEWVLADPTAIIHLSGQQWAACSNGSIPMRVTVKGELKHAARPDGCLRVTLPPDSELSLGGNSVRTGRLLGPERRVIPVPPVVLPRDMLAALAVRSNGTTHSLDQLRGWHPGAVLHSATELRPVQIASGFPWWEVSLGVGSFILTGLAAAMLSCLWQRWRPWCGTRKAASPGDRPTTGCSGGARGAEQKNEHGNEQHSGRHLEMMPPRGTGGGGHPRDRRSSLPDPTWEQKAFLLEKLQSQGSFLPTLTLSPSSSALWTRTTSPSAHPGWTRAIDQHSSATSSQRPRTSWISGDSWAGGARKTKETTSSLRSTEQHEVAGAVDVYIA